MVSSNCNFDSTLFWVFSISWFVTSRRAKMLKSELKVLPTNEDKLKILLVLGTFWKQFYCSWKLRPEVFWVNFFSKTPDLLCMSCPFPFYPFAKFQEDSSLKSALFLRFISILIRWLSFARLVPFYSLL